MRHLNGSKLYSLFILLTILAVGLATLLNTKREETVQREVQERSPYHQPVVSFGVACTSELSFPGSQIRFNLWITHPPGRRDVVDEAVRHLIRSGPAREAWSEATISEYNIVSTRCFKSWQEQYGELKSGLRSRAESLLEQPNNPTDADLRQAILRTLFERMGTEEEALELFPHEALKRP